VADQSVDQSIDDRLIYPLMLNPTLSRIPSMAVS
jgi:hypothetical protein